MDERDRTPESPNVIEGTDAAALGTAPPPTGAPPGAQVDPGEGRVPGPTHDAPPRAAKPWATSLAADSDQAGVANDPPEVQDDQYPTGDDEAV